jgi:hypothetical protein
VDPMRRTKQLQPAGADEVLVLRAPEPEASAAAELLTTRASRVSSGFCLANRKIWCSEYQPSRVSGGCAMGGDVMV